MEDTGRRRGLAGRAGAVAAAAAYLPAAREAYKSLAPMVSPVVQSAWVRLTAQRNARRQARDLLDGSWLAVYVGTSVHYVVWSGDEPVNAFPPVPGNLHEITRHVDLSHRHRPDEGGRSRLRRPARGRKGGDDDGGRPAEAPEVSLERVDEDEAQAP